MTKKTTNSQTILESSKALTRTGLIFAFLAIITLPAAPLVGPLFCKKNSTGVCTLDSSVHGISWVITLIAIFGIIAISLIIAGGILRIKAKKK